MIKPIKISRSAIKQAIKQTPIEQILVGAHNADKVNLTKKQKDFAKAVALGKPKAQAYRESYNSKGKPQTEAQEGNRLAKDPKISAMISAFTLANEAREYLIPAQIRTMAIQNLVGIAIDQDEKTSNKLKALELIGKMSEVSLFSETKTHLHLHTSADIKLKLLEGLRLAFANTRGVNDLAKRKAESLLVELSEARPSIDESAEDNETRAPSQFEDIADPPPTDPQISSDADLESLHSIPLKGSEPSSNDLAQSLLSDLTLTAVKVTNPLESSTCVSIGVYPNKINEGEGVIISDKYDTVSLLETPPVNVSNTKG
jgi:hypothetical protein